MSTTEILIAVGSLVPWTVIALMSIEFGDKQMSVLDRWLGPRHAWARDHHGID
jgi:hypothetical protein